MSARFKDFDAVQRLVDNTISESVSLEYKEQLDLTAGKQRLEALKDLTGLGNGGGGTIVYGVKEVGNDNPVAEEIVPLTDWTLPGRLEDIVRAGVRSPLLVDYQVIEAPGGYLLSVDIQPSPLGPYMVEGYGSSRYYLRIGTRTMPMGEQQVRDAYLLAARARERRPQLWADHDLPLKPPTGGAPWLTIAALPEEPLPELLDLRHVTAQDLKCPESVYIHNSQAGAGLGLAIDRLTQWVDGFFGDDATATERLSTRLRLYRDGAFGAAILVSADPQVGPVAGYIARVLNGSLLYLGWLSETFGLTRPVELRLELHLTADHLIEFGPEQHLRITALPGLGMPAIVSFEHRLPYELKRASVRHSVVMRFADRLHQAVGNRQATELFRAGQLYGADGTPLQLTIGGSTIWGGMNQRACVHRDGFISSTITGGAVAYVDEGVVTDLSGDTLAVVEMAPGRGCPDTFQATQIETAAGAPGAHAGDAAQNLPSASLPPTPTPSGQWSTEALRTVLLQP